MADKEPMVVIKKITIVAAGAHGGAWKVAFADFMTALMAFFLVMWLVAQSEEVKKNVADYFSTPSIIEYNFSNYGVELTLEKLFLDLVNEPLKFFQSFIKPVDYSPNIMAMGSKKVVLFHVADKLGDLAKNVEINSDEMLFEIEAKQMFFVGTARTTRRYVEVMDKVQKLTMGLEDSIVYIDSQIYKQSVDSNLESSAKSVADKRLSIILKSVETTLEHDSVDIFGRVSVEDFGKPLPKGLPPSGLIRFRVKQKTDLSNGKLPRKLEGEYGENKDNLDVYNNFVNKLVDKKKSKPKKKKKFKIDHW